MKPAIRALFHPAFFDKGNGGIKRKHALLSNTKTQHLSAFRGGLDRRWGGRDPVRRVADPEGGADDHEDEGGGAEGEARGAGRVCQVLGQLWRHSGVRLRLVLGSILPPIWLELRGVERKCPEVLREPP